MPHLDAPPTAEPGDGGRLLASAMSWNVVLSAVAGLTLLGGGVGLSRWLGVDAWVLMGVGVGLLTFAGVLLWLLSVPRHLVTGARWVVAADVAWVVGAVILLAAFPSVLAAAGKATLAAVTTAVAVVAAAQLAGLRRHGPGPTTAASPVHLQFERVIAAPAHQVWDAVADAGDYARFAPGIATSQIVAGDGEGMVRVCTDDRGGEWSETCTLWEDGHRYRMTVDVASYPVYYRMLLHEFAMTWELEPTLEGTRLRLSFDGAVKLGILGRLAVRMLGNPRRLGAILDGYERELIAPVRST